MKKNQYIKKTKSGSAIVIWALFFAGAFLFYLGLESVRLNWPIAISLVAISAAAMGIGAGMWYIIFHICAIGEKIRWEGLFPPKKYFLPPEWEPPRKKPIPRFTRLQFIRDGKTEEIAFPEPEFPEWRAF